MAWTLKVPDIACEGCAQTITESIHATEPNAKVNVDVKTKTVTVESTANPESIKKAIVDAGYTID
ncbi:MAG: heavy-metal-associated domain-containing protein [Nostocaceae cyanobacterium]|nr:heavy-metal-associated domain-containing protein [Nostocaceae cyanobacterium]